MFIDGVDFDFCDKLIKNNFYIIQSGSISLTHEIGHIVIKKFLWFDVCVRNHSAFRKYYISRNIIYLDKKNKYKYYPIVTIVLLYEEDKLQKIKQIFKGIKDGFKMKI